MTPMLPRLLAVAGPLAGNSLPLSREETSVGRDETNDLVIADASVAPHHCVLAHVGGLVTVRDRDRRNPTFVNGLPGGERAIEDGDEIQIGDSLFVVRLAADQPGQTDLVRIEETPSPLPRMIVLRREDVFDQPVSQPASPERLSRDLATLMRTSAAINAVRGLVALERPIIELIADAVPASRGALLFVGDSHAPVTWSRPNQRPALRVRGPVIDRVMRDLVGVLCFEEASPARAGVRAAADGSSGRHSVLAAPLIAFDQVIGAIVLEADPPVPGERDARGGFDEGHLRLVMAIAGVAATAFAHARQMEGLERTNRQLQAEINLHHNMVGESAAMREVYRRIARVAPTDSTVLVTGESGTGKELVARAIHRNSPRTAGPFVAINCAAITESLLESELFGHEKGAFTGAVALKKGKLEVAEGGTVFLDEIGELSPALQAKLLRVLQDKVVERVGGTRPLQVDFRLLAATNRDLKAAIDEGAFRRDLYYRLNVVSLAMPPLRERRDDIVPLADWFLGRHRDKAARQLSGFSPEALFALTAYDWPGNVRELENAVEHAVILGQDETIGLDDLPDVVAERLVSDTGSGGSGGAARLPFRESIEHAKVELVTKALEESGGNHTAAAHLLGLHPNYLHRLIRNLQMRPARK
jgi:transcriptional regulator with GAF, ATPase, and Fis domain